MRDLVATPEAKAQIDAAREVLELLHDRPFYLRVQEIESGFRRPTIVSANDLYKSGLGGPSHIAGLFGTPSSDAHATPDVATIFLSPEMFATSFIHASAGEAEPADRIRRLRARYLPLTHLDRGWERIERAIARRRIAHEHAPYGGFQWMAPPPAREAGRVGRGRPIILFGMYFLEIGGAEIFALETIRRAAVDADIVIVTDQPSPHGLRSALADLENVRIYHIDRHVPEGLETEFILRLVAREKVSAVHIHHCGSLYAALPALKLLHREVHVSDTTHVVEHRDGGFARLSILFSNFIDHHHVISKQLKAYMTEELDLGDKVTIGYLNRGAPPPAQPRLSEARAGGALSFAFIGRMVQQKRPLLFVHAAAALSKTLARKGLSARFTMMGDGPQLDAVKALVARFHLEAAFTFQPPDFGAERLLAETDILVVPSENEGLTLVAFEAFGAGAFVVSADVGSQGEIVPAEALLPPRPSAFIAALVKVVEQLADEPAFRTRLWAASLALKEKIAAAPQGGDVVAHLLAQALSRQP